MAIVFRIIVLIITIYLKRKKIINKNIFFTSWFTRFFLHLKLMENREGFCRLEL